MPSQHTYHNLYPDQSLVPHFPRGLKERLAILRQRLRAPSEPARVWMRRQWRSLTALGLACVGVVVFDSWLTTCGFQGCPTRAEVRGFRPGEGGKIVDRNDRFLGRI